jgi:hypothetical protein
MGAAPLLVPQRTRPRPAAPLDAIPAILDAFRSYQVVSFPGGHTDGPEVQAVLRALVEDPRFAATVNDIVVEFGRSKWQADSASWKLMTVTAVRGTALGAADFSEFENPDERYRVRGDDDFVPIPRDQWVKRPLEDIVDAASMSARRRAARGPGSRRPCG